MGDHVDLLDTHPGHGGSIQNEPSVQGAPPSAEAVLGGLLGVITRTSSKCSRMDERGHSLRAGSRDSRRDRP